jgi:hypothetical protein
MRDSTIVYRSFYEAIIELPKENQAEVWQAIFEYSLNFKEVQINGLSKTIFTLIKPQLDANIKKFHNGKIPKVKKEESKLEAKTKQKASKKEANVNVNDNVNDNKKENVNNIPEFSEFLSYAKEKDALVSQQALKNKYDSWVENDWKDGYNKKILNWKSKLLNTLQYLPKSTEINSPTSTKRRIS